jgi:ubiquinone/menaquinone biosynthesis C-methylase UbiE
MEAFYALAMRDYRELEEAHDWAAELRDRSRAGVVSLLDVACGSGRFPTALLQGGLARRAGDLRVDVDLLDPSPFSIVEARAALAPPFAPARELPIPLQDLAPDG